MALSSRLITDEEPGRAVARHLMVREAVGSVALSHRQDCVCLVCRAANGDEDALIEVHDALAASDEKQDSDAC